MDSKGLVTDGWSGTELRRGEMMQLDRLTFGKYFLCNSKRRLWLNRWLRVPLGQCRGHVAVDPDAQPVEEESKVLSSEVILDEAITTLSGLFAGCYTAYSTETRLMRKEFVELNSPLPLDYKPSELESVKDEIRHYMRVLHANVMERAYPGAYIVFGPPELPMEVSRFNGITTSRSTGICVMYQSEQKLYDIASASMRTVHGPRFSVIFRIDHREFVASKEG